MNWETFRNNHVINKQPIDHSVCHAIVHRFCDFTVRSSLNGDIFNIKVNGVWRKFCTSDKDDRKMLKGSVIVIASAQKEKLDLQFFLHRYCGNKLCGWEFSPYKEIDGYNSFEGLPVKYIPNTTQLEVETVLYYIDEVLAGDEYRSPRPNQVNPYDRIMDWFGLAFSLKEASCWTSLVFVGEDHALRTAFLEDFILGKIFGKYGKLFRNANNRIYDKKITFHESYVFAFFRLGNTEKDWANFRWESERNKMMSFMAVTQNSKFDVNDHKTIVIKPYDHNTLGMQKTNDILAALNDPSMPSKFYSYILDRYKERGNPYPY